MKRLRSRFATFALLIGVNLFLVAGCAVTDGGYGYSSGYSSGVSVGVDYYNPSYGDYGGWGSGYRVGPYRNGAQRHDFRRDRQRSRGFRPAPRARAIPSIPSRPHNRGSRGGRGPGGRR
jgi:hypothetical protein